VTITSTLAGIEAVITASGAGQAIDALLPAAVRGRQLSAGTLLAGKMLALADGRPAHLTRAHAALLALPENDQERLGVTEDWKDGPHQLTYRQVEHTSRLVKKALARPEPDGSPSPVLQRLCNQLTEASIPGQYKNATTSMAADWTDAEAWGRPVPADKPGTGTDPEARWGHRNVNRSIQEGEMFFGYYLSAAVMVAEEGGEPVPELVRRITAGSSAHDPAAALAAVLADMAATAGVRLGDILADSGYSHRVPQTWAEPLRAAGAQLVQDLHPHDRGPQGTHQGAIIANGNLYCPKTAGPLLDLVPPPPGAGPADLASHDQQTAELARYKLGLHAEDADGYRRHICPAATGKIRCPLRPQSMTLDRSRPEILTPPEHPPACCTQQTITAGPGVAAKTRQKHDYPSAQWRASYARRTAAERVNAGLKDPAVNNIDQGWIRQTGVTELMLCLACLIVVRNQRTLNAWEKRQEHHARAAARPRTRKRRRQLAGAPAGPP
jgi:hypothetical protein